MIAIIDYKAGNLRSVERALHHLDLECVITRDSEEILKAERVIFPGVGAAGKAMETIIEYGISAVRAWAAITRQAARPSAGVVGAALFIRADASDSN